MIFAFIRSVFRRIRRPRLKYYDPASVSIFIGGVELKPSDYADCNYQDIVCHPQQAEYLKDVVESPSD